MNLREELKAQLIEQLNLVEVNVADIEDNAPLFGEGLGLDSIDALELIVLLDNQYNIEIDNPEHGQEIFQSVNTMAAYIEKRRAE